MWGTSGVPRSLAQGPTAPLKPDPDTQPSSCIPDLGHHLSDPILLLLSHLKCGITKLLR